ncbi:lipase, partial [Auriscalpium vulgare]
LTWSCGANCNANPDFLPEASGGDGGDVPFCGWPPITHKVCALRLRRSAGFVGFAPAQNTVIVSHQGADSNNFVADLTDNVVVRDTLNPTLFPGMSSSITVHAGFAGSQSRSAAPVLAAVKAAMTKHSTKTVTVVGHSLGGAIALLDSVSLSLRLPSGTTVNTVVYGLPRVGNKAFADYVDAHQHVTHINNKDDPVPVLPYRFLGFVHPSGEVRIQHSDEWYACPGQDNTSDLCIVGAVPNIFESTVSDHKGPYDGVEMGC